MQHFKEWAVALGNYCMAAVAAVFTNDINIISSATAFAGVAVSLSIAYKNYQEAVSIRLGNKKIKRQHENSNHHKND